MRWRKEGLMVSGSGGRSRQCPGADRCRSEILGWNYVYELFIGTTYCVRAASPSLPASAALLTYPYTSRIAYACWDRTICVVACSQDNFNTLMLPVYVEFKVLHTSARWPWGLSVRISWVPSILLRWSSKISFPLFLACKQKSICRNWNWSNRNEINYRYVINRTQSGRFWGPVLNN